MSLFDKEQIDTSFDDTELASLKKANQKEFISKEEFEKRVRIIAKAKRDIVWWANNFFRIINLDKGLTLIKLYPKQEELLRCMVDSNRCIVLSARQSGKTTSYTVFCLWLATLFTEKKILIAANKMATATEVMDRIRRAYEYIPSFLKPGIMTWNKNKIEFSNMSSIAAFATSSSACRGASAGVLILDEFAFLQKNLATDFFNSVVPIVSSSKSGKIIIVSTPNGKGNLYYDIWEKANSKDKNEQIETWTPFRIRWFEVPGRDEDWKQQQINSYGMETWRQEYECEFLSSKTKKLIPDDIIDKHRIALAELKLKDKDLVKGKTLKIVSANEDKIYSFTMWHEFKPGHAYVASGDVGEGLGSDSSVLYIWDVSDLRNITMCAKYCSNTVSLTEFEFVVVKLCALYNNPWLIIERNGVGSGVLDHLNNVYGYPNLVREGKENRPGIYSHVQNKGKSCLWAREMMTTKGFGFTFYDQDLLDEMTTFVKHDTKVHIVYSAITGAHDDLIMSFVWMCYMLQNEVVDNYYIVCQTFQSSTEQIYAQILKPQEDPDTSSVSKILNDPVYAQFLEFKEEAEKKFKIAMKNEQLDNQRDIFKYQDYDPYFGDSLSEASWNMKNMKKQQSFSQQRHSFYINHSQQFSY